MNTSMFGALILEAHRRANDGSGKMILVKAWPGPVVAPVFFLDPAVWGPHRMSPSWPGNSTPVTVAGRSAALAEFFPYAFATFLMAASETSWLHYAWWYDLADGTSPAALAPSAYADLAPWLDKPLGAPLGPPTVAGTVFSRSFARVAVRVDLANFSSASFAWL